MGNRKWLYMLAVLMLIINFSFAEKAQAAAVYKGTFEEIIYSSSSQGGNNSSERVPTQVVIKNSSGTKVTFNIDKNTNFYINNTLTTVEGFKKGMPVEAKVTFRKITELRGTVDSNQGSISPNSKQKAGIVTKIDPNGMFIQVKLDNAQESTTYYINKNTVIKKGQNPADLSALYEGDRVILKFSSPSTSVVSELNIAADGILVKNIYRGNIQSVNSIANSITLRNAQKFENWTFGTSKTNDLKTFPLEGNAPVYVGTEKVSLNELKSYRNSMAYLVTIEKFGREVVERVVVNSNFERTYYEQMTAVNPAYRFVNLETNGRIYFHEGTILIRNGRLVEPATLTTNAGTAFVVTDGLTDDLYAQIIHITNDSFTSPNLASHQLYFGKLSSVVGYRIELDDLLKVENNYWKRSGSQIFSFSNDTDAAVNNFSNATSIIPKTELETYKNRYGYFYVKDGHVNAIRLLEPSESVATKVLTGRINGVKSSYPATINVRNVSQWSNGAWIEASQISNMKIHKALIIKNGQVINPSQLKMEDRVVIFTNSTFDCHVILVNE